MDHLEIIRTLPAAFRCISLELARETQPPGWDWSVGYLLVAPLDSDGRLDAQLAADFHGSCRVLRLRPGAGPQEGYLRRGEQGGWFFESEGVEKESGAGVGFRLGDHRFVPGASVSLNEDGRACTYRVVSVSPL